MSADEVKMKLFAEFERWMRGQTVGVNPDGSVNYYAHDVEKFLYYVRRISGQQLGVTD